jgi:tRNA(Ile)-lysidine synthase
MPLRPRLTPAIANTRRAVRECFERPELSGTKRVLLAVSGGADSMALSLAAGFELPKIGIEVFAAIINHNLQDGSKDVALSAMKQLAALGIEAVVIDIKVSKTNQGPEAAARDARYQALEKHRADIAADHILLGHNLDDQAETVLLGLTRGSGLKSIAGMKVVDGFLVRPLIGIEKAQLETACSDSGVDYWKDPHNQDEAFTRVRIRKLMRLIERDLGPGVNQSLARTAVMATDVDDFVSSCATKLIQRSRTGGRYKVSELADAHVAVRNRALQMLCLSEGANSVSYAQMQAVAALITNWHGQKPVSLSGITVERVKDQLLIRQSSPRTPGA